MAKFHVTLHETRAYMGEVEAADRTEAYAKAVEAAKKNKLPELPARPDNWAMPSCSEVKS